MSSSDLRSVEILSGLGDDAVDRLAENITACSLAQGDTLFNEGDPGSTAYIETSGEIEILKISADRTVRIAISEPGVIVCGMSLLTGEPGKGTGLGLDAVYDVVANQHHGTIEIDSTPDRTAFTVTLPITPPSTVPPPQAPVPPPQGEVPTKEAEGVKD